MAVGPVIAAPVGSDGLVSPDAAPDVPAAVPEDSLPGLDVGSGPSTASATVVACPDGPLLIRGDFELVGADGKELPRNRRTVALCRCGASALKPYCDGSHKLIGFRTEP